MGVYVFYMFFAPFYYVFDQFFLFFFPASRCICCLPRLLASFFEVSSKADANAIDIVHACPSHVETVKE